MLKHAHWINWVGVRGIISPSPEHRTQRYKKCPLTIYTIIKSGSSSGHVTIDTEPITEKFSVSWAGTSWCVVAVFMPSWWWVHCSHTPPAAAGHQPRLNKWDEEKTQTSSFPYIHLSHSFCGFMDHKYKLCFDTLHSSQVGYEWFNSCTYLYFSICLCINRWLLLYRYSYHHNFSPDALSWVHKRR